VIPEAKPDKLTPEAKPDKLTPEAKPEKLMPEAKPEKLMPEAKPEKLMPEAKPEKLISYPGSSARSTKLALLDKAAPFVLSVAIVVLASIYLTGQRTLTASIGFIFFVLLALTAAAFLILQRQALRKKILSAHDSYQQLLEFSPIVVFEIDANLRLQGGVSGSFEVFFYGKNFARGTDFLSLISFVSDVNLRAAGCAYARLLFADQSGEAAETKNPLEQVTALLLNESGKPEDHYFSIKFSRRFESGSISRMFVAICDVSELTRSSLALVTQSGKIENDAQETLKLLTNLLSFDRNFLATKLHNFEQILDQANLQLKNSGAERENFFELIKLVLPQIYSLRKSAEQLNLTALKLDATSLVNELEGLSQKTELAGNDFFGVALRLDELYDGLRKLNKLVVLLPGNSAKFDQIAAVEHSTLAAGNPLPLDKSHESLPADTETQSLPADTETQSPPADTETQSPPADTETTPIVSDVPTPKLDKSLPGFDLALIQQACVRTAEKLGKKVALQWQDLSSETVPDQFKQSVTALIVPLVRNALNYAVERPGERISLGKLETAILLVSWRSIADGYELLFKDDGRGLNLSAIRSRAVALQRVRPENAETLGLRELAGYIFQPGFSTAANGADPLGFGFGGGLDVITEVAARVGAKVSVATQFGIYTQFRVRFPKSLSPS
jgi:hypothetical protein